MKISEINIDNLFTKALPGATVTVSPDNEKTYKVITPDGTRYRVALSERSRVRQMPKDEKFSEENFRFLTHADRIDRLQKDVRSLAVNGLNQEAALAWLVADEDGARPLELVMSSLVTLRKIAKEDDSPFSDNPSGIDYRWDRFGDAAQYPGVYTARID